MDESMKETAAVAEEGAFDEGWGDAPAEEDEDFDLSDGNEAPEAEEPAEQEEAEGAEDAGSEGAEPGAEQPAAENQRSWKLKHNGEEVEADEARMVELAQKGLDYDRVRGERDSFKTEHPKYADYEKFLGEMAESAGTDVPGLRENVRASLLMKKAKAEGRTLSEAAAIRQVREAAKSVPETPAQTEADRRRETIRAFAVSHPNVKGDQIPVEVLKEGIETGDLSGAYDRWENGQLRKALEESRKELETMKQNQKNKERSTGSRRSAGASTPKDDFDEGWDSL